LDQIGDKPTEGDDGAYVGSIRFDVFENNFDISKTNSLTFEDVYAILYASLEYLQGVARDMERVKQIKDKLH
jgi:hypothetical protein